MQDFSRFTNYSQEILSSAHAIMNSNKNTQMQPEHILMAMIKDVDGVAGDYLKEASDSNMPLVAIGLLYKFGYFTQELSVTGEQQASLVPQKFSDLPIEAVLDEFRHPLTISLNFPGRVVKARIWKVQVCNRKEC